LKHKIVLTPREGYNVVKSSVKAIFDTISLKVFKYTLKPLQKEFKL